MNGNTVISVIDVMTVITNTNSNMKLEKEYFWKSRTQSRGEIGTTSDWLLMEPPECQHSQ